MLNSWRWQRKRSSSAYKKGGKVQFLICGTQKGGTTALADYLRKHPELFLPKQKELHFFDDENQDWAATNYEHYESCFCDAPSAAICGEATPIYMYWDPSPARIWNYNPAMKLIVLLRNPISRAYAHWAMETRRGQETLPFEDALIQEEARCRKTLPQQHRVFSYQDRGFYSQQIRRLWHFFGREAVLVIRQEALRADPMGTLNHICQHLGVKPMPEVEPLQSHSGQYKEPLSKEALIQLKKHFRWEILALQDLLEWDCQNWLEGELT